MSKFINYEKLMEMLIKNGLPEDRAATIAEEILSENKNLDLLSKSESSYEDYVTLPSAEIDMLNRFIRNTDNDKLYSLPNNQDHPSGRVIEVTKTRNDRLDPVVVNKLRANSIYYSGVLSGEISIDKSAIASAISLALGSEIAAGDLLYLRAKLFSNFDNNNNDNIQGAN